MRTFVAAGFAAFALASPLCAQDDAERKQGWKEVRINETIQQSQQTLQAYGAAKSNWDATRGPRTVTFNAVIDKLNADREQWLQQFRVYEDVVSLRFKDEIKRQLDEARKQKGVSDADGARRIGVHNAFTGESYTKYYDDKTGELKVAEIRALFENLEARRLDFEQSRHRARAEEVQISADYQKVLDGYQAASAAKKAEEVAVAERNALYAAQAEARQAEAERRRLEAEAAAARAREQQRSSGSGRLVLP